MGERWMLLCLLSLQLSGYYVSGLQDHEIVFPERLVNRVKRDAGHSTDEHVSYIIQTANDTLVLNLQRNRDFVSKEFEHFTYSKDDGLEALNRTALDYSCYYHGQVEGQEDSVIALSDCHGLRGIMYWNDMHYGIEPMEHPFPGAHRLYQMEEPDGHSMCGVEGNMDTSQTLLPSYFHLRRMKRAVLPVTSYVELGVVVDNLRYKGVNSNSTAVEVETIQLVNIVDGMFRPLNIRIVLTNLITWTTENPIDVNSGTAGDVLGRFSQWRSNTNTLQRCDIYHLLIGRGAFGDFIGMAFIGTVCSPSYSNSISTFSIGSTPPSHAVVVAHELGHVLGMNHDDGRCPSNYIMFSIVNNVNSFSKCSSDDFEALVLTGRATCLHNQPNPDLVLSIPVCGNNIVEKGEECDCGSVQDCKSTCCDAATCRLTSGSQCDKGLCCENCKFKVGGTMCRSNANMCDLPEYCNGSYALCPVDVYIMNGYPCNDSASYCYNGVCQNYDIQCQALLGPGTRKAPDICYQTINIRGDQYGNCGDVGGRPTPCSVANTLCGKLQCIGSYVPQINSTTIVTNYDGVNCIGIDFNLGPDVPDPGLVNPGTPCAADKACLDNKCVNASELGFNCDVKGKCNDHGVCNNKGNCHCNDGWAPPYCDKSGYGGSIDSGPAHIDTSLRDGLLIFFLLVLPIIIVIVVMFIKRDAIRRRFCRRRRSRGGNQQSQAQNTNRNQNAYANRNQNAYDNGNQNTYANYNGASNTPRNQDQTFSDVFTISHNFPQRQPAPPRPPPPTRPPPPSTAPQYNWPYNV
ncbi:disintegrin and metalloproteinase domain-containing protein 9-like [Leptodactylus fuscus]|uniref:disintegrin and metalloproteinase domain-containing protein 9-like n=1 Tax=Leptodactylus fuscus TaxID=238119 RepID=UPI003F4EDD71